MVSNRRRFCLRELRVEEVGLGGDRQLAAARASVCRLAAFRAFPARPQTAGSLEGFSASGSIGTCCFTRTEKKDARPFAENAGCSESAEKGNRTEGASDPQKEFR